MRRFLVAVLAAMLLVSAFSLTACGSCDKKKGTTVAFEGGDVTVDEWQEFAVPTAKASDGSAVVYSVADESVLYIRGTKLTGLKAGKTDVVATLKSDSKISAKVSVTVREKAANRPVLTVTGEDSLFVDDKCVYTATLTNASSYTVTYKVDDATKATINNVTGELTGVAEGSVVVTAETTFKTVKFSASKTVTVAGDANPNPKELLQDGERLYADEHGVYRIDTEKDGDANGLRWLTFRDFAAKKAEGYKYLRFKVNFTAFARGMDSYDDKDLHIKNVMNGGFDAADISYQFHFGHRYGDVMFWFDNWLHHDDRTQADGSGMARTVEYNIMPSEWYFDPYTADGNFCFGKTYSEIRNHAGDPDWTPYYTFLFNTDYIFEYDITEMPDLTLAGFDYAAISEITWSNTKLSPVNYVKEYYFENLAGEYVKDDSKTQNLKGISGATAEITDTFEHYTLDAAQGLTSATIKEDGSLVLKAYYTLETVDYTVTYYKQDKTNAYVVHETVNGNAKYGATVTAETKNIAGYTLNSAAEGALPSGTAAAGLALKFYYDRAEQTYTVEHYKKDGDNFPATPTDTEEKTALTLAHVEAVAKVYDGFQLVTTKDTVAAGDIPDTGALVLKLYYEPIPVDKVAYAVEYYLEAADGTFDKNETVQKSGDDGATITADELKKNIQYYVYDAENADKVESITLATGESKAIKLYYKRAEVSYTVKYYLQNVAQDGYDYLEGEDKTDGKAAWGKEHTLTGEAKAHCTLNTTESTLTAEVDKDGNTVFTVKFDRDEVAYTVTHKVQTERNGEDYTVKETENLTAVWGTTATAIYKEYEGYEHGDAELTVTVAAEGTANIDVNYTIKVYTATVEIAEQGESSSVDVLTLLNKEDLQDYTVTLGEDVVDHTDDAITITDGTTEKVSGFITAGEAKYHFDITLNRKYVAELRQITANKSNSYYFGYAMDSHVDSGMHDGEWREIIESTELASANGVYDIATAKRDSAIQVGPGADTVHMQGSNIFGVKTFERDGKIHNDGYDYLRLTVNFSQINDYMFYHPKYTGEGKICNFMIVINDIYYAFNIKDGKVVLYTINTATNLSSDKVYVKIYKPDGSLFIDGEQTIKEYKTANAYVDAVNGATDFELNTDYVIEIMPGANARVTTDYTIFCGIDNATVKDVVRSNLPFRQKNYTVNYYFEQQDGSFVKNDAATVTGTAAIGEEITAEQKSFIGYVVDTDNAKNVLSGAVGNGGLTLSVYYRIDNSNPIIAKTFNGLNGTATVNLATEINSEITGEATVTVDGEEVTVTEGVITLTAINYYNKGAVEGEVSANGKTYGFVLNFTYENVDKIYQNGKEVVPDKNGIYRVDTEASADANGLRWLTFRTCRKERSRLYLR